MNPNDPNNEQQAGSPNTPNPDLQAPTPTQSDVSQNDGALSSAPSAPEVPASVVPEQPVSSPTQPFAAPGTAQPQPPIGSQPAFGNSLPQDNNPQGGTSPLSQDAFGQAPSVDSTAPVNSSQPDVVPPAPAAPINKRKTGMLLLLVVVVSLAAAAWLVMQAFSS